MKTEPLPYKLIVDAGNVLLGCSSVLAWGDTGNSVEIDFGRYADQIAGRSNRSIEFVDIAVHWGVCDPNRHPARYASEMARIQRWERDSRVKVHTRRSRFDESTGKYQEKCVDTAIALDVCTSQASGKYAGIVLASADRDLLPAVEHAYEEYAKGASRTRLELARWQNQPSRLWLPGKKLWCHYLDESDLARCSTRRNNRSVA